MCGIVGLVGRVDDVNSVTSSMIKRIKHRGPDSSGIFSEGPFALGHCRLSIIDKSDNSRQPVIDVNFVLGFNGEIYNWKELREKLKLDSIRITSDTLLLFELIKQFSLFQIIKMIRGIYTFVVFDRLSNEVTIVRDKFGTKPFYLLNFGGQIFFASEIKAFLGIPFWTPEINKSGLENYLTFQNNFGSETIFKNVKLLPANSITRINLNKTNKVTTTSIPDDNSFQELTNSRETWDELQRLVTQAISRNLVADVNIGGYLSGGIDSSIISSIAESLSPKFKTFTIGFDVSRAHQSEMGFDESDIANSVSKLLKTEHYHHRIGPSHLQEGIDRVSWAVEDPKVGQSYPNLYAAELAAKHVRVCLSGTGGDEIFAGYPWRYGAILSASNTNEQHDTLFKVWHRLGTPLEISKILNLNESDHISRATEEIYKQPFFSRGSPINLKSLLEFEQSTFLQGLLIVEDKLSMANSLEVRVPFLDEDLFAFAKRLPDEMRFDISSISLNNVVDTSNFAQKEQLKQSGKIALRKLAQNLIPSTAALSKQGFSAPDSEWFRILGPTFIKERLGDSENPIWTYLDFQTCQNLIDSHMRGDSNRRLLMWSLVTLESTVRQFGFSA